MNSAEMEAMFCRWWGRRHEGNSSPAPILLALGVEFGLHVLAEASKPPLTTLAEAREAARQLGGPCAEIVHRFLDQQVASDE